LRRILSRLGWVTYDHLGGIIGLNLVWAVASAPWVAVGVGLLVCASRAPEGLAAGALLIAAIAAVDLVIFSPATALLFLAARRWVEGRPAYPGELLAEIRQLFFRAQAVGLMVTGGTVLLMVNFLFYRRLGGWAGAMLSGTMLWALLGLYLVSLYLLPCVAVHGEGDSAWAAVRQSCRLVLMNLKATLGLMALVLLGALSGLVVLIPLLLGLTPVLALLIWLAFQQVVEPYGVVPAPQSETRTWRDLVKPWDTWKG